MPDRSSAGTFSDSLISTAMALSLSNE